MPVHAKIAHRLNPARRRIPKRWIAILVLAIVWTLGAAMGSLATLLVLGVGHPEDAGPAPVALAETTIARPFALPVPARDRGERENPAWQRHGASVPIERGRPLLAIVIDDMGLDRERSTKVISLPGPLTLSFLSYAGDIQVQASAARVAGHEVMAHIPMEPRGLEADPGPGALLLGLGEAELRRRLSASLGRFSSFVGINNHMGSRFTEDPAGMALVMSELRERGLLFLDSVTTADSVAAAAAGSHRVPYLERDVFLDHDPAPESIRDAVARLEELARRRGFAIAIGHPRDATIEVLARWLPTLHRRGFVIVPISTIARRQIGIEATTDHPDLSGFGVL